QSRLVSLAPGSEENRHLVGRAQNGCILTGFASCPFRPSFSVFRGGRRYVDANNGPPGPITTERRSTMTRLRSSVTLVVLLVCSPIAARADVVLDWNAIAVSTLINQGQNPFAQARFLSITQLAVFEAVNAITGHYKPY